MTDTTTVTTETPTPAPKKRAPPKRRRKPAAAKPPGGGGGGKPNEFAGMTATECCAACTPERCVISTVGVCKHPYKTADSGCGPITMRNRLAARKILKKQKIDVMEG